MNEKIRAKVASVLASAIECDAKAEIIDEITANLVERFNDLVAQGASEDDAYVQVISSIGDVSEIISFINGAANKQQSSSFDFNAAFDGFEKRLRDLAKDLETPIKEVAKDFKAAAISAKEPLRDMGRGIKNAVKDIEFSIKGSNYRYDYTIPSSEINGVAVSMRNGAITFGVSEDDNIYVVENSNSQLSDEKRISINIDDNGVLTIEPPQNGASFVFFGLGVCSTDVEIFLPKKSWKVIAASTVSGDIRAGAHIQAELLRLKTTNGDFDFKGGIDAAVVEVKTTSGDFHCRTMGCEAFNLTSISGDVELAGTISQMNIKTTSGDVSFSGETDSVQMATTSGDLDLAASVMPTVLETTSVSGDIKILIPENDGFSLKYKKVSGDLNSDFNLMTSLSTREGVAVYRNGDLHIYSVKTVSGDVRILRR